jgi:hypothetical protein
LNAFWLLLVFAVGELTLESYLQATRATLICRTDFTTLLFARSLDKASQENKKNNKH